MSFFSVYKPGQGYWTRVLTALGVAILVLTGAFWFANDVVGLFVVAPKVSWPTTDLGAQLAAWGKAGGNDIAGLQGIRGITLNKPTATFTISDQAHSYDLKADELRKAIDFSGAGSKSITPMPAVPTDGYIREGVIWFQMPPTWASRNLIYIQLICAGVIILGFALLLWWTLNRPRIVEFAIATEAEMRKVNWPTRYEVLGSTWVVICGTLIFAVFLFGCDSVFTWFFQYIRIL